MDNENMNVPEDTNNDNITDYEVEPSGFDTNMYGDTPPKQVKPDKRNLAFAMIFCFLMVIVLSMMTAAIYKSCGGGVNNNLHTPEASNVYSLQGMDTEAIKTELTAFTALHTGDQKQAYFESFRVKPAQISGLSCYFDTSALTFDCIISETILVTEEMDGSVTLLPDSRVEVTLRLSDYQTAADLYDWAYTKSLDYVNSSLLNDDNRNGTYWFSQSGNFVQTMRKLGDNGGYELTLDLPLTEQTVKAS